MSEETNQTTSPENETPENENARLIAEAKARADAAKARAEVTAAQSAPVKKKEEGPKPIDASDNPLVVRMRGAFGVAIVEAKEFLKQLSIRVEPARIVDICDALKNDSETPFEYLCDLTCIHYPEREDAPFEIVYNLYSISKNERVFLKTALGENESTLSVTGVWATANWLEREVFDLFGVRFTNHPDLRRILLPTDWEGHPFRKDYMLEFVENDWTKKHLPPMDDVQKEIIAQRRAYGLEMLCVPEEHTMREIIQGGKEVMTKDK
jgi:NADH-quinone oxidoreductase subunit C